MANRTDLLNFLIEKHDLERYLEIGVQNPAQNFDKIECERKVSVDPDPNAHAIYTGDSDTFFRCWEDIRLDVHPNVFDLIFIDGLHTAEQVKKDFENALQVLSPNGFICIHDCNPELEEHTIVPRPTARGHYNGDVYKFAASLLTSNNSWTIDIDNGCLVYRNLEINQGEYAIINRSITWQYFDQNRKELLNLISWDEFIATHSNI